MPTPGPYQAFLDSPSASQWKRVKVRRRAAVATPLFSVYSDNSIGVGEFPDLKLLAEWCRASGIGIIQLLPMNDVGFNFRPYDAESSLALEPMHLSLKNVEGVEARRFAKDVAALCKKFPPGKRVDTRVKAAKLALLEKMFEASDAGENKAFQKFVREQRAWLEPYAVFKVLKEKMRYSSWEDWPLALRHPESARQAAAERPERTRFHEWLQWQLYRQFTQARAACAKEGVLLMGDLPFLVSRDSADVWSHQSDFKLDLAAGAPPDLCFAEGQRWGMPPYDWKNIESRGYDTLAQKLRYAENFYDLFRIDHFVGIFRLWSFPLSGREGFFDPPDEKIWEAHGRKILSAIMANTRMLPCAEDLGTVPDCSYRVLKEFALPGMDVQRWTKTGLEAYDFKRPDHYRSNSMATSSTHDLAPLAAWWEFEAGTVDEVVFRAKCAEHRLDADAMIRLLFDPARSAHGRLRWKREISDFRALPSLVARPEHEVGDLIDMHRATFDEREKFWTYLELPGAPEERATPAFAAAALEKLNATASIFTSALLQDWLALGDALGGVDLWDFRINFPGTMSDRNWTLVMPLSLEKMKTLPINKKIKALLEKTGRVSSS